MQCPHCLVAFHDKPEWLLLGKDVDGSWALVKLHCPACRKLVLSLSRGEPIYGNDPYNRKVFRQLAPVHWSALVYPRAALRKACPSEVLKTAPDLAADHKEACLVLADSPKASAALSRRCLQSLLRQRAGVTPGNLADEIQQVLDSAVLPSHLAQSLDAVRQIGNFAAHPIKSTSSGEVVPVEPGEAEWTLDTLDGLFDFYFVQPALTAQRRAALEAKLKDAGKPPLQ